jgi:hypothetical protein
VASSGLRSIKLSNDPGSFAKVVIYPLKHFGDREAIIIENKTMNTGGKYT